MLWYFVIIMVIVSLIILNRSNGKKHNDYSASNLTSSKNVCPNPLETRIIIRDKPYCPVGDLLVIGIGGAAQNVISVINNSKEKTCHLLIINNINYDYDKIKEIPYSEKGIDCLSWIRRFGAKDIPNDIYDDLKKELEFVFAENKIKKVLIVSGFGGRTGIGMSCTVAKIVKENGLYCSTLLSTPFNFEGYEKHYRALNGIKTLYPYVDSIICFNLEYLRIFNDCGSVLHCFELADYWMSDIVCCTEYDEHILSDKNNDSHGYIPIVKIIKNESEWLPKIKELMSQNVCKTIGVDYTIIESLKLFFLIGTNEPTKEKLEEIKSTTDKLCSDFVNLDYHIIRVKEYDSKIILFIKGVNCDQLIDSRV